MECRVGGYKFLRRTSGKTSLMREHLRKISLKREEEILQIWGKELSKKEWASAKIPSNIRGKEGREVIGPLGPSGSFLGLWFYLIELGSNENILSRVVTLYVFTGSLWLLLRIDWNGVSSEALDPSRGYCKNLARSFKTRFWPYDDALCICMQRWYSKSSVLEIYFWK